MDPSLIVPIAASLLAGAAIGFERDYRGRPAGLRTHAIVGLAATVLMMAAMRQGEWAATLPDSIEVVTDPTRMAHGILTGIGFLCAGVIFREGFSVHGLTTASTLWGVSAVGVLFGVEQYALATFATLGMLLVLVGFRLLWTLLPRRPSADILVRTRRESDFDDETLRNALGASEAVITPTSTAVRAADGEVEHGFRVTFKGALSPSTLARRLASIEGVLECSVSPHDERAV